MGGTAINVYRLAGDGLARVFGDLEAQLMEVLWERGEATVPDVMAVVGSRVQYNTVQTVLNRLTEKGVLQRRLLAPGGAYLYSPSEERGAFLTRVSSELVASLFEDFGQAAVMGLVDAFDSLSPEQMARIEAVLLARRASGSR